MIEDYTKYAGAEKYTVLHFFCAAEKTFVSTAELYIADRQIERYRYEIKIPDTDEPLKIKKIKKRAVKLSVFRLLKAYFKSDIPWGSLTGIRPTKLFRELFEKEGRERTNKLFTKTFDVSAAKRN